MSMEDITIPMLLESSRSGCLPLTYHTASSLDTLRSVTVSAHPCRHEYAAVHNGGGASAVLQSRGLFRVWARLTGAGPGRPCCPRRQTRLDGLLQSR